MFTIACRTLLPSWGLLGAAACLWMPSDSLLAITPWVCGVLLSLIGLVLAVAIKPYFRSRSLFHKPYTTVAIAAALAPIAAVAFAINVQATLSQHAIRDIAVLVWLLSSLGLVLSTLVARLLWAVHPGRTGNFSGGE